MSDAPAAPDLQHLAAQAAHLWSGDTRSVQILQVAHHATATFLSGRSRRYLRLTPNAYRSRAMIDAELEFVAFLKNADCDVAAPIPSTVGPLVQTFPTDDGEVHAAVFEEVTGEPLQWGTDAENRPLLFQIGQALGQIHRASKRFQPTLPPRFHGRDDVLFHDPRGALAVPDRALMAEYETVMEWIGARPVTIDNYGMIHGDFGSSNCRHRDGRVIAFDFDDCCYHWFAFDIAIAMWAGRQLPDRYRAPYLRCLLDGYETQNSLAGVTREDIAWFTRLVALYRYAHAARSAQDQDMRELREQILHPIQWS